MDAVVDDEIISVGALQIRASDGLVTAAGRPLTLSIREFELLLALARRSGRIIARDEVYREAWGSEMRKGDRSVDVYVHKLRDKLEAALPQWRYIHTHLGFGYRLAAEPVAPRSDRSRDARFTGSSQQSYQAITGCWVCRWNSRSVRPIDEGAHVKPIRILAVTALSGALAFGVAACGDDSSSGGGDSGGSDLSGTIKIDGSSTVFPFAQAAAEQFKGENSGVNVSVGESGTGGGFEKFCAGETDISNASRPIKDDEEAPVCKKNGVALLRGPGRQRRHRDHHEQGPRDRLHDDRAAQEAVEQGLEGLQLQGASTPPFPDQKVALFGPGTDSGTFDFFTAEINGEEGDTRKDYSPSEDDNVTVQGVSGDKGGLGYLGFSYFEDNADNLNLVKVDSGGGCVEPTAATIQDGSYKPLARPLFMYPSAKSLASPEVKGFMDYILANQQAIADASKIVALTDEQATEAKAALTKAES